MPLSANTVWEVRTDGDDGNGGGFVTGASGVDRSQQAAAHATLTTASVVHSTTTQVNVDAGDHTVAAADVGNLLQITGGTATVGPYQITAVDVGNNRWTLDRSVGTAGQTVAGKMGGALASLGGLGALIDGANFNDKIVGGVYVRSGAYTITTATANTSGGPFDVTHRKDFWVEGYNAAGSGRGDLTDRPVITVQSGVSPTFIFNVAQDRWNDFKLVRNVKVDGNGQGSVDGFISDQGAGALHAIHELCEAVNCPGNGFEQVNAYRCVADGNGLGFMLCTTSLCIGRNNTSHGSQNGFQGATTSDSIFHDNGGSGVVSSRESNVRRCLLYNNAADGFNNSDGNATVEVRDCVSVENGAYNYRFVGTKVRSFNNASYNGTSGDKDLTPTRELNFLSLTADPFVDAPNDDFNINNTAGGGAVLRAVTVDL